MRYGYAWASRSSTRFVKQIEKLDQTHPDQLLSETGAQPIKQRPVLQSLLNRMVAGDQLIVTAFDRLSRDPEEVVQLLIELSLKGIKLVLLDIVSIKDANEWEVSFLTKKLLIPLKQQAELDYAHHIHDRQAAGIAAAKAQGVYHGRPILYGPNVKNPERRHIYREIEELLNRGESIYHIQQLTGRSNSLIRRIKQEVEKEKT